MRLEWETRTTHITREVPIGVAELVHGNEHVLFQIKPHQDNNYLAPRNEEGLDLLVQIYIPSAPREELERVARLIAEALYE